MTDNECLKLEKIYNFLEENQSYNRIFQQREYYSIYSYQNTKRKKVISLLYNILNSQSQPKINNTSNFFKCIYENIDKLDTFETFVKFLNKNTENANYENLYIGLKSCKGWGDKTSALFTKVVFNVHNGSYDNSLQIWDDTPKNIINDKLYLPVDRVIINIFNYLKFKKNSFLSINKKLNKCSTDKSIAIWDDLWFWGFITQKGSGSNRVLEWNLDKYWSLEHSDKSHEMINEIETKARCFIKLLK